MKNIRLLWAVVFVFSLAACGGGNGEDGPKCVEQRSLCARLFAPQDFTGKTVNLMALFFNTPAPSGMPAAILAQIAEPDIGPGRPFGLKAENINAAAGTYYFYVALYMEGGGTYTPVEGVDYVGTAAQPVVWNESPVSVGDVQLSLYKKP